MSTIKILESLELGYALSVRNISILNLFNDRGLFLSFQTISYSNFWFILVLLLGIVASALWLFFKGRAIQQAVTDIAQGRYRYGLFFWLDQLILRSKKNYEYWSLKEIVDIKLCNRSFTHHHVNELILVLRNEDGTTREYKLKGGFAESKSQLVQRISSWCGPGFYSRAFLSLSNKKYYS